MMMGQVTVSFDKLKDFIWLEKSAEIQSWQLKQFYTLSV